MKHCPECNIEYRDEASICSDCDVALVDGEPEEAAEPDLELERVYATGNPALVPIVKSLLDDAGIKYLAKGDAIQDLIGWGRFGGSLEHTATPFEFLVAPDDVDAARAILEPLDDAEIEEIPEEEWED